MRPRFGYDASKALLREPYRVSALLTKRSKDTSGATMERMVANSWRRSTAPVTPLARISRSLSASGCVKCNDLQSFNHSLRESFAIEAASFALTPGLITSCAGAVSPATLQISTRSSPSARATWPTEQPPQEPPGRRCRRCKRRRTRLICCRARSTVVSGRSRTKAAVLWKAFGKLCGRTPAVAKRQRRSHNNTSGGMSQASVATAVAASPALRGRSCATHSHSADSAQAHLSAWPLWWHCNGEWPRPSKRCRNPRRTLRLQLVGQGDEPEASFFLVRGGVAGSAGIAGNKGWYWYKHRSPSASASAQALRSLGVSGGEAAAERRASVGGDDEGLNNELSDLRGEKAHGSSSRA
mmetsp:Transcript_2007/g.4806  ORF Transcript_2007/g.4806 Transcript_2007/m.4806 type:complete len:354 (-) Transcript_2007:718-1779(-)